MPRVGVLALQGDFEAHVRALAGLGVETREVRRVADLRGLDGLVIPGGESTTFLNLMQDEPWFESLRALHAGGGALLGTCAGAILLSREVRGPSQPSLGLLDAVVERNAYGRQVDSFEASLEAPGLGGPVHGVFIRAPRFTSLGPEVEVLARHRDEPVLVRQGRVLAGTFHPELTGDQRLHRSFVDLIGSNQSRTSSTQEGIMRIYIDGSLVSPADAKVSVFDHGFLYGDGVFEGIRVYDGTIFRLQEHIERLYESAKTMDLQIPMPPEEMTRATVETVAANERRDAYIRLVVSRGAGDLGIDPANCKRPTVVIIVGAIKLYPPEFYERGVSVITASTRRIPVDSLDPRLKSLNYLNNILGKIEAKRAGAQEAIMLNHRGYVAECTADNVFMVKKGVVATPDLLQGALGGITRAAVLELAREAGMRCEERALAVHDFYNADECFLTGTGAEIVPVVSIDGRAVGTGRPGGTTLRLRELFRDLRVRDGVKVTYGRAGAAAATERDRGEKMQAVAAELPA